MGPMTGFNAETPWVERPLAAFDLETTDKEPLEARIVTASLVLLTPDGEVLDAHEWLADPGVEIPEEAAKIHGVSTERARAEGKPVKEVVDEIWEAMDGYIYGEGAVACAFNASYDFTVMHQESVRHLVEPLRVPAIVDPYVLNKQFHPFRRGKRTLSDLSAEYGVALEAAHTSAADSLAAGLLTIAFGKKWARQIGRMPAGQLHCEQITWAYKQAESLEAYFRSEKAKTPDPNAVVDRGWPLKTGVMALPDFEALKTT